MLQNSATRADARVLASWDSLLRRLCQIICRFLLGTFSELQDALLAFGPFRSFVGYAYAPHCQKAVLKQLRQPNQIEGGFDSLSYHISPEARQLLIHACLHALVPTPAPYTQFTTQLPPVGRILLQTGTEGSGKYQEAIAGAVAKEVGAELLVIDDQLLASVAKDSLGGTWEQLEGDSEERQVALLPFLLSFWLSGGRMSFVWDMVQRVTKDLQRPLVVFIRDVEQTVCGSYERHDAFVDAFGKATASGQHAQQATPMVLIGGCSLGDTGAHLTQKEGRPTEDKAAADAKDPGRASSAEDDALPTLLPTAAELSLSVMDDKPKTRKLLPKLFSMRVRLQAPLEGPAAAKHAAALGADAAAQRAERNHQLLAALAAQRKLSIPPSASEVYSQRPLSAEQWTKVLSWAVSMQIMVKTKESRALAAKLERQILEAKEHARLQGEGRQLEAAFQDAQRRGSSAAASSSSPAPSGRSAQSAAIRRVRSACSSAGVALDAAPLVATQKGAYQGKAQAAGDAVSGDGADASMAMQSSGRQADGARLQADGAASSSQPSDSQYVEDRVRERLLGMPAEALQEMQAALRLIGGQGGAVQDDSPQSVGQQETQAAMANALVRATLDKGSGMLVSEAALWYGLRMLDQAGGSIRPAVEASNAYERRLLPEVIRPDLSAGGFAEVGALEDAKTALRETVQLPLQHPHLFARGSLAAPCKGVLLFGPPGTGKTLLARAAAAECGASFLAIHPSTVASKWLGDGVRYVRAVFSLAAKLAPCVLFLDEVDALLGKRDSRTEHEALREIKNEFMAQWDGIRPGPAGALERVMVLGATNRPQDLDPAVLRRFSRRIFCDLPSLPARHDILEVMLAGEKCADDVDLDAIAGRTEGFSGSDLRALCTAAAMIPVRQLLKASGKSASVRSRPSAAVQGGASKRSKQEPATSSAPGQGSHAPGRSGDEEAGAEVAADGTIARQQAGTATGSSAGSAPDSTGMTHNVSPSSSQPAPVASIRPSDAAIGDAAQLASGALTTTQASSGPAGSDIPARLELALPNGDAAGAGSAEPNQHMRYSASLDRLIDECGEMAKSASRQAAVELRPLCAKDFEEALKDVTPSTSADGFAMEELKQWNSKFGEKAARRDAALHLSYFL